MADDDRGRLTRRSANEGIVDLLDQESERGEGSRKRHRRIDHATLYLLGVIASLVVLGAVIGVPGRNPLISRRPAVDASPRESPRESRPASSNGIDALEITAGLVGLPPPGAKPSKPSDGVLLDEWRVYCCNLPYRGTARLYADGRLVWNRYYGPGNSSSTGYLEQRLTPLGVHLVLAESDLSRRDPASLRHWLPGTAWQEPQPRAYVPRSYAACVGMSSAEDWTTPAPYADLLEQLPPDARDLLRSRDAREDVVAWGDSDCRTLTTDAARLLDRYLRTGGFGQDALTNRYQLQYENASPGAAWTVEVVFEPIFPDGSVGCSSCG